MGTIKSVYDKVHFAYRYLPDEIDSIVMRLSKQILDLNREDQLFEGMLNDGRKLPKYGRATEEISRGTTGKGYPKRQGDVFNMYATGRLFKSIDAIYTQEQLIFKTTDPNHPFIRQRPELAKKLFGLTKENQQKLNYELILPMIRKWVQSTMK